MENTAVRLMSYWFGDQDELVARKKERGFSQKEVAQMSESVEEEEDEEWDYLRYGCGCLLVLIPFSLLNTNVSGFSPLSFSYSDLWNLEGCGLRGGQN